MASFSINIEEYLNLPPNQLGILSLELNYNQTYSFTVSNFTSDTIPVYEDPEGDVIEEIKILSLPIGGTLLLNSNPLNIGSIITSTDIMSGLFTYTADPSNIDAHNDSFTFDASDIGSHTFSGLVGTVSIFVDSKVNLPPSSVGDGEETINYGQTLVFTRAMFTTSTVPPYSDPEGDAALNLRVNTLPNFGLLKLNGIDIVINQIISFNDIDSGLFTYTPDLNDTDGSIENFEFQIADAGSGQFVG